MEKTIHPEALKASRNKRGWSQKQLAEKSGISSDHLSRLERGKAGKLRSHSRERLTKVLGVSWDELTRAPDDTDKIEPFDTVQLNVRVQTQVPTALDLVCNRYNVRRAEIIELAPLLFLITAEKSLARREKNLDAIEKHLEQVEKESWETVAHLAPAFYSRDEASEAICDEQKSINHRDISCRRVAERYDIDDFDPYVTYLNSLVTDLPDGLVKEIVPSYRGAPSYIIAWDSLRELTGISEDSENGQELLNLIWEGRPDLREVLSMKQALSQEEYLLWLSEQHEVAKAKQEAAEKLSIEELIAEWQ